MSSKSSKTDAGGSSSAGRGDLPETVTVGRVLRPHGVRGEVVVEVLSDVAERFSKGSRLLGVREGTPPLPLEVAASRAHKNGAVVRFAGCEDRDRAEELRGLWLEVPRSQVPAAEAGTYYQYELLGCLCRVSGEELGRVAEVVEDGGGLLLIIEGESEGEGRRIPVPFVREFLREVDVAGARIELELPPGLVETCASRS
ncbi:MAG TPA: ribosome maturation factor RimM [Thermoanaerobaculia bacterium]|jgi:16S rRNA processing protein RimM|nr:ribosome maturation factor RimM [Thermoanaerobaculia bacterium]